jgi:hypothetical protein
MRRVLLACCLAVLVVACATETTGDDAVDDARAPVGQEPAASGPPLDFTAPTVDGGQLDASSLQGRDVVLWFWAPW